MAVLCPLASWECINQHEASAFYYVLSLEMLAVKRPRTLLGHQQAPCAVFPFGYTLTLVNLVMLKCLRQHAGTSCMKFIGQVLLKKFKKYGGRRRTHVN